MGQDRSETKEGGAMKYEIDGKAVTIQRIGDAASGAFTVDGGKTWLRVADVDCVGENPDDEHQSNVNMRDDGGLMVVKIPSFALARLLFS